MNETDTKETDLALGDAEIASIIAVSKKAIYQKSQKAPTRDTKNFNARKLGHSGVGCLNVDLENGVTVTLFF